MPTDIRIIDLGGDTQFAAARNHLNGLLEALTLTADPQQADRAIRTTRYEVSRPRDRRGRRRALAAPARLLHLMGHGEGPGVLRGHRWRFPFHTPLDQPITATGLLLDVCGGYTADWLHHLPQLIPKGRGLIVIGSAGDVTWAQAAAYTSTFYTALLHRRLPARRQDLTRRVIAAHHLANESYRITTRTDSPFLIANLVGRGPLCR